MNYNENERMNFDVITDEIRDILLDAYTTKFLLDDDKQKKLAFKKVFLDHYNTGWMKDSVQNLFIHIFCPYIKKYDPSVFKPKSQEYSIDFNTSTEFVAFFVSNKRQIFTLSEALNKIVFASKLRSLYSMNQNVRIYNRDYLDELFSDKFLPQIELKSEDLIIGNQRFINENILTRFEDYLAQLYELNDPKQSKSFKEAVKRALHSDNPEDAYFKEKLSKTDYMTIAENCIINSLYGIDRSIDGYSRDIIYGHNEHMKILHELFGESFINESFSMKIFEQAKGLAQIVNYRVLSEFAEINRELVKLYYFTVKGNLDQGYDIDFTCKSLLDEIEKPDSGLSMHICLKYIKELKAVFKGINFS